MSMKTQVFQALAVLVALVSPVLSQGAVIPLSQSVYDALEALEQPESRKYENALAHLTVAKEHTRSSDVRSQLDEAIRALRPKLFGSSRFPTDAEVSNAVTAMRTALSMNRIELNRSFPHETELLEKLVAAHLFPEAMGRVRLSLNNIDKSQAMKLLLAYFADPERSVKYDPDVALLVQGRQLNSPSGDPDSPMDGAPTISFIVSGQEFEAESATEAWRMKNEIEGGINQLARDNRIPIRTEISVVDQKVAINLRVEGFKYAPIVETWLWNTSAWAADNRYLMKLANGLESASTKLETSYMGGQQALQGIAKKMANVLTMAEDLLRLRMVTGKLATVAPTVETVKEKLTAISRSKIAHMEKNLVRLKDLGAAEAMIAKQTEKTTAWIAREEARLAAQLEKIDKALSKLDADPAFQKLSDAAKAQKQLDVAKKTANIWLSHAGTVLKTISAAIVTYYAFEWAVQANRIREPGQRLEVHQKYGAKVVTGLMYLVPVLGEAAFALDVGSWMVEKTVQQAMGSDIDLPNTEALVHKLFKFSEDLGYWSVGTTRFQAMLMNGLGAIPPIVALKDKPRFDAASLRFERALQAGGDAAAAKKELARHVSFITGRYALLIFRLVDATGSKQHRELGRFEEELYRDLFDKKVGYLTRVTELLGPPEENENLGQGPDGTDPGPCKAEDKTEDPAPQQAPGQAQQQRRE